MIPVSDRSSMCMLTSNNLNIQNSVLINTSVLHIFVFKNNFLYIVVLDFIFLSYNDNVHIRLTKSYYIHLNMVCNHTFLINKTFSAHLQNNVDRTVFWLVNLVYRGEIASVHYNFLPLFCLFIENVAASWWTNRYLLVLLYDYFGVGLGPRRDFICKYVLFLPIEISLIQDKNLLDIHKYY